MLSVNNRVKSVAQTELRPQVAFVFYGAKNTFEAVTKHHIHEDNTMGAGRNVSMKSIANLVGTVEVDDFTIIPSNVVVSSSKCLAWTCRAKKRPMWFSKGKQFALNVHHPHLLFVYEKNTRHLKIGVIGSVNNVSMDTRVYHPPLMNVNDRLSLCQGTATLPKRYDEDFIRKAESTLFESNFSHKNTSRLAKGVQTDRELIQYWKEKEAKNEKVTMAELHYFGRLSDVFKGVL